MGFSFAQRIQSIGYAWQGVRELIASQHNAWVHLAATVIVVALGLVLGVSRMDWVVLLGTISMVWVAEALNTAVEYVADAVTQEEHPLIGKAKDVAAGGVLLAACGAVCIGVLVFWPYVQAALTTGLP